MLSTETKLDPRVKRTRQLLQKAMEELLREKGFSDISVQDITARAEVNRATFYAHFKDKYDLLDAIVREMFQNMLKRRLPESPSLSAKNLRLLILTACEYLGQFIGHCKPAPNPDEAIMVMQVQILLYETILCWMREADSAEIMARVTGWAIFGAALEWARGDKKHPAEQMADQVLPFIMAGLPVLA